MHPPKALLTKSGVLMLTALLGGPAAALVAQNLPTLTVFLDGPAAKRTSIGGFNLSNAMLLVKVKDKVAALRPATYTWPAGNVGDEYPIDSGVLDYLRLQQKFVPAGFWFNQFNLFQGTLDQALAQVKGSRERGIRTDAWTIGNEPDLYGPNRGDYSWTAEKYAKVFREWATALKAAYPDIVISGPALSQPKDEWMKVFIAECGDLVDILNWHWYPTDGKASDLTAMASSQNAASMVARYQSWLVDPKLNPRGYQRPITTAVTEFAVHWDTSNDGQINDMVGATWTADVLGQFAEAGLDYSHFFCLQEYGGHAIFTAGNKPRVLYHVFDFYQGYADAVRLVRTEGRVADGLVTAHGWVDAAGQVSLVITNRSDQQVSGFALKLAGRPSATVVASRQLTETSPVAVTWGPGLTLDLPVRSVTSVILQFE